MKGKWSKDDLQLEGVEIGGPTEGSRTGIRYGTGIKEKNRWSLFTDWIDNRVITTYTRTETTTLGLILSCG